MFVGIITVIRHLVPNFVYYYSGPSCHEALYERESERTSRGSVCCILLNRYWGITTVPAGLSG